MPPQNASPLRPEYELLWRVALGASQNTVEKIQLYASLGTPGLTQEELVDMRAQIDKLIIKEN